VGVFLTAAVAVIARRPRGLALVYLWGGVAAFGAAYYHARRELVADEDISHEVREEPWPVQLRGTFVTEPVFFRGEKDPLRSFASEGTTRAVLRAARLRRGDGWAPVSGLVQLTV